MDTMSLKLVIEFLVVTTCLVLAARGYRLRWPARAFARRRGAVCLLAAALVLLLRAVLLPFWPVPKPSIYDEFSYLLQSDTFAHGRLANPPHPQWQFFETIYVLQQPAYVSKYPPGQGLALAIGQVLIGSPWAGVWLSCAAMAAALCWALQGWFPAEWALAGMLIALDLCTFSHWMNSYWGGAVAAIGGALVIGAYGRIARRKSGHLRLGFLFGLGIVILLLTRPYEGFLLAFPVSIALFTRNRGAVWIPITLMTALGFGWLGYYDYRTTGHPLRMPYQEYFSQYESVPPLTVMADQPTKSFRHFDLEFLDSGWTRDKDRIARHPQLAWYRSIDLFNTGVTIYGDAVWLAVLLLFGWRQKKLPAALLITLLAGAAVELVFYSHYAAPFTALLLILLVQALRRLRAAQGNLVVAGLILSIVGAGLTARLVHVYRGDTPDRLQSANAQRGYLERKLLAEHPGRHVVFVRYTGVQKPHEEWIYNLADIDAQPVIWAQDMGSENAKLAQYYPGRSFWLFQPDIDPNFMETWK
jgi:hypothetical protein